MQGEDLKPGFSISTAFSQQRQTEGFSGDIGCVKTEY